MKATVGLPVRRFGLKQRVVLLISILSIAKGASLLQASKREMIADVPQKLNDGVDEPAAVAASDATASVTATPVRRQRPQQPIDCRHAGPHRRAFSDKELALQAKRFKAWKTTARGVAMCLTIKGWTSLLACRMSQKASFNDHAFGRTHPASVQTRRTTCLSGWNTI